MRWEVSYLWHPTKNGHEFYESGLSKLLWKILCSPFGGGKLSTLKRCNLLVYGYCEMAQIAYVVPHACWTSPRLLGKPSLAFRAQTPKCVKSIKRIWRKPKKPWKEGFSIFGERHVSGEWQSMCGVTLHWVDSTKRVTPYHNAWYFWTFRGRRKDDKKILTKAYLGK